MLRLALALALSFCAVAAPAAAESGPLEVVAGIYDKYQQATNGPDLGAIYSRRLQQLIDADRDATPEGEVGRLDWDVFVEGNDWELTKLHLAPVSEAVGRAQIRASFDNHAEPREILIDLVLEDGRWLVDEVQSTRAGGRWTMSKILAGAPDAFPDEREELKE